MFGCHFIFDGCSLQRETCLEKFNVRRNMQRAISFLFKYCFKIWVVIKLAKKKVFALNDIGNIGGEMLLWNAVIISIHVMIRVFNQGFKSLIIRSGSNGFKCFVMAFYDDCTLRNALVWRFSYDWFYWSRFQTAWLEIGFLLKVYEIFRFIHFKYRIMFFKLLLFVFKWF